MDFDLRVLKGQGQSLPLRNPIPLCREVGWFSVPKTPELDSFNEFQTTVEFWDTNSQRKHYLGTLIELDFQSNSANLIKIST